VAGSIEEKQRGMAFGIHRAGDTWQPHTIPCPYNRHFDCTTLRSGWGGGARAKKAKDGVGPP
jgi:hypothetical protein